MRTFILVGLTILPLAVQWLIADDALTVTNLPVVAQAWTAEQITNTLRKVEAVWAQPPDAYISQADKILRLMPDEPHARKMLFMGISGFPLSLPGADMKATAQRLEIKWRAMFHLAGHTSLRDDAEARETLASMVGWARLQIIPDYQPYRSIRYNVVGTMLTEEERRARMEEQDRRSAINEFQRSLRDTVRDWESFFVPSVCRLASKMPPDGRKRFLDRIKELARSDETEAKLLIEETVKLRHIGMGDEHARKFVVAAWFPEQRKQKLDEIKAKSDYTEEELEFLEELFE